MPFATEGSAYYSVKIEGQQIDLVNFVSDITIIEHSTYMVPVAMLTLIDGSTKLDSELAFGDGTTLTIAIGPNRESAPAQDFIIFNGRVVRDGLNDIYHYTCILDVPNYWAKSVSMAIRDKSSKDALKDLAGKLGLEFDGEGTSDKQTWLNLASTGGDFAQRIAEAGYINDMSCMSIGVTADKKLLYKDLAKQIMKKDKIFVVGSSPDIGQPLDEVKFNSTSGFRNAWLGYGQLVWFDDIQGKTETLKEVVVQKPSESFLALNSDVKSAIEYSRIDTQDFDAGNVHENYQKARYQNLRIRAMYSQVGSILVRNTITGLKLFDPVWLDMYDAISEGKNTMNRSGAYVTFAKTRVFRGGTRYAERVEIMRPHVKNAGLTGLIG